MFSREKSSRGSDSPRRPTRSGLRNFIASAVGRLRNSPGRIFQRLDTQMDSRKHCSVEPLKWAARVVFRHFLPISSSRACESRVVCGTRPAEFSTAGHAHRFACAPSGPCPARVCKPSRSLRRRGAACLSARTCVPRRSHKTFLYLFELWGQISPLPKSARTIFESIHI